MDILVSLYESKLGRASPGTDGSVDERSERMGAGYVICDKPIPIQIFSAPLGGPHASIRPEEASLLQILRDVAANHDNQTPLLIFVDCLVLFDILSKWGRHDSLTVTRSKRRSPF